MAGSGYPCIVIHGGLGLDHNYLKPFLTGLEKSLQLVYYDQRGNGRSQAKDVKSLTHGVLAQDCEKLRESLNLQPPVLLGHSYGGFIALEYASRYPKKLAGLVLVDTASSSRYLAESDRLVRLKATPEQLHSIEKLGSGDVSEEEYAEIFRELLPLYMHNYSEDLADKLVGNVIFNMKTAEYANKNLLPKYDVTENLVRIRTPSLVAAGKHDIIIPPSQSTILKEALPNAELALMDTGHFPFAESPEEFARLVGSWVNLNKPTH